MTINCPLYEDLELPPPDARQQWDSDGLPKYVILALRCARLPAITAPTHPTHPPPIVCTGDGKLANHLSAVSAVSRPSAVVARLTRCSCIGTTSISGAHARLEFEPQSPHPHIPSPCPSRFCPLTWLIVWFKYSKIRSGPIFRVLGREAELEAECWPCF